MAGSDVVMQAIEVAREIIADVADAAEGMVVLPGGYAIFPTVGEARGPFLCKVARQAHNAWDRARYPAGVYPDYALSGSGAVPPTRAQAAEFLQWEGEIRKAIRG